MLRFEVSITLSFMSISSCIIRNLYSVITFMVGSWSAIKLASISHLNSKLRAHTIRHIFAFKIIVARLRSACGGHRDIYMYRYAHINFQHFFFLSSYPPQRITSSCLSRDQTIQTQHIQYCRSQYIALSSVLRNPMIFLNIYDTNCRHISLHIINCF